MHLQEAVASPISRGVSRWLDGPSEAFAKGLTVMGIGAVGRNRSLVKTADRAHLI